MLNVVKISETRTGYYLQRNLISLHYITLKALALINLSHYKQLFIKLRKHYSVIQFDETLIVRRMNQLIQVYHYCLSLCLLCV